MAFDGSGNFLRIFNWVTDKTNSVNITASRMDTEDNGFAAGLTLAVTRDGQGKMATDFLPGVDNTYNLGSAAFRWTSINGQITFSANKNITLGAPTSGIALTVNGSGELANFAGVAATDPFLQVTDGTITGILQARNTGGAAVTVGSLTNHNVNIFANNVTRMQITPVGDVVAKGVSQCRVKAATTGRNTTTTLADDPDLVAGLPAGTYSVRLLLLINGTTSGAQGFKWQLAYSGTIGNTGNQRIVSGVNGSPVTGGAATVLLATPQTFNTITISGSGVDYIEAVGVFVASGAGSLSLQWAQNSSTANNTNLLLNSHMLITPLV